MWSNELIKVPDEIGQLTSLKEVDLRECPRIDQDCLDDLMLQQKFVKVYR